LFFSEKFSDYDFLISIGVEFHTTAPVNSRLFFCAWFRNGKIVVMTSCITTTSARLNGLERYVWHVTTFIGNTICLLTNQKMIKIVTLIDSHIVLTYECWHCFLVFNIWVSHALEMTIHFYYPTLVLFCFSFTQPFTHSKFTQPFSLRKQPPSINNDRSPYVFLQIFNLQIFMWLN
jgi:hypothetical protein